MLINVKGDSLSPDSKAYAATNSSGLAIMALTEVVHTSHIPTLTADHLVIDGLFGTGLRNPLEGGYMAMARYINESGATVVSIDVLPEMYGDWNSRILARNVVHADLTVAVQFPRLAFFLSDNALYRRAVEGGRHRSESPRNRTDPHEIFLYRERRC